MANHGVYYQQYDVEPTFGVRPLPHPLKASLIQGSGRTVSILWDGSESKDPNRAFLWDGCVPFSISSERPLASSF